SGKANRIVAKPGDTIPLKGLDVRVLASAGSVIGAPLPGAGQANSECAQAAAPPAAEPLENQQSLGLLITYGEFRLLDLGDLTMSRELTLVCPANRIGAATVLVASHHMGADANTPQLLRAVHPKVAIGNNGPRKGGDPEIWQALRDTPGLQDVWQ